MMFCTGGLSLTAFSPYMPYLIKLKGLSNTQNSVVLLCRSTAGVAGMAMASGMIRKFDLRITMTAAMTGCACGYLIFGAGSLAANCFLYCCIAAMICGLFYGMGSAIAASILIGRWFKTHGATALGITQAATGVSTFIASPLITWSVEHAGLSRTFFAECGFIALCAAAVYLMVRSSPEEIGAKPFEAEGEKKKAGIACAEHTAERKYILILTAGILMIGMAGNNVGNISVLLSTAGYSSAVVSTAVSLFGISLASGKLVFGVLADRIGVFKASTILLVVMSSGLFLCTLANTGTAFIQLAGAALTGFGTAICSVAISSYAMTVSSKDDYARIVSRFQTVMTAGGLVFTTVPGMIADSTGSYVPAYILMLCIVIISAFVLQITYLRCTNTAGLRD